jgi:hypothetical protein
LILGGHLEEKGPGILGGCKPEYGVLLPWDDNPEFPPLIPPNKRSRCFRRILWNIQTIENLSFIRYCSMNIPISEFKSLR